MNTSQGPIQPFGEMRLKTLEVIIALIDEEGPTSLLEKFVELNTPRTIIVILFNIFSFFDRIIFINLNY